MARDRPGGRAGRRLLRVDRPRPPGRPGAAGRGPSPPAQRARRLAAEPGRRAEGQLPLIAHPLTGEVLPDDLDSLVRAEAIVDRYLRRLSPHYAFRRELRERIAELRGPAELPGPRWQTDRQRRVAECPRCGAPRE